MFALWPARGIAEIDRTTWCRDGFFADKWLKSINRRVSRWVFVNDRINSPLFLFSPPSRFFTGRNKTKFLINANDNGPIRILLFTGRIKNRNVVSTLLIRIQLQLNDEDKLLIPFLLLYTKLLVLFNYDRLYENSKFPLNNDPSSNKFLLPIHLPASSIKFL